MMIDTFNSHRGTYIGYIIDGLIYATKPINGWPGSLRTDPLLKDLPYIEGPIEIKLLDGGIVTPYIGFVKIR